MVTAHRQPNARVFDAIRSGEVTRTVLKVDKAPSPPVAPGGLYRADGGWREVMQLRRLVAQRGNELTFETYGYSGDLPLKGDEYVLQSWWTPDQLQVAKSTPWRWKRERFKPSAALVFRTPDETWVRRKEEDETAAPDAEVVPGAWDHEHCILCWRHLCAAPECEENGDKEGWTDGKMWVCEACYASYIASGFGQRLG